MENGEEKFDLKIVHDKFDAALHEEDDVDLELYLESWEELNNSDLRVKMDHLKELLKDNETCHKYKTVKTMIEHEKENGLLNKDGYISGSRTLLRIHRGLDFIQLFLKNLGDLENDAHTSPACREAYEKTLAKHHSFFIRNGARMAMFALPTREQLLTKVCKDEDNIQKALDVLPKTLEKSSAVYVRIDTLYTKHDLHSLP